MDAHALNDPTEPAQDGQHESESELLTKAPMASDNQGISDPA
jgi:hypothetical protein